MLTGGTSGGDFQEGAISAVISSALEGEAAGHPTDTLFVSSPLVVVNGMTRSSSPLFAGISPGGQVAITSSQVEIRSASSWGVVDYRWETSGGITREGRATFVLTQVEPGHWQIQHVHSSSPQ
jgi:hypothetical protein